MLISKYEILFDCSNVTLEIYLFFLSFFSMFLITHTQIWVTAYSDRDRIMPKYPSLLQKTNARTLSSTKTKEFQRLLCITDMHKCYNYYY